MQPADQRALANPTPYLGTLAAEPENVQTIFALTNQDRSAHGLAVLAWDPRLAAAAREHARRMAAAASQELSHRYPGEADLATRAAQAGAGFSSIAENIAQGGSATAIEKQWMHSVPHRTNILDPRMTVLGVAVFPAGGTLYAVEDFAAAQAALSREQIESQVEASLRALASSSAAPLAAESREQARAYCAQSGATAAGGAQTGARFELVWEGADLKLPQPLVDAIRTGRYHAAAVGSCPAQAAVNRPFTVYRTAVLLF